MGHHCSPANDPASSPRRSGSRARWSAIGAAIAVTVGSGGLMSASASISSGPRSVFVPITPCRLLDTRPAPDQVGPRSVPLGSGETVTQQTTGTNGNCAIPADAVAVSLNVTQVNGSAASYLTLYPADAATRPLAANLNWVAGAPPTPNKVDVGLSSTGAFAMYNFSGTVDVIVDIAGYYAGHDHDDRYYTKAQTDDAISTAVLATGSETLALTTPGSPFVAPAAQQTLGSTSFTTTKAGRLHVTLHVVGGLNCSATSSYDGWLVVDGTPLANSHMNFLEVVGGFDSGGFPENTLQGITESSVAPGAHSVAAQFACDAGATAFTNTNSYFTGSVTVLTD